MSATLRGLRQRVFAVVPWSWWGPLSQLATRTGGYPRRFRREQVGSDSYVDPSVQIAGWQHVRIGRGTTISEECWLNVNFRDEAIDRISIGDDCHIGRRNFFSAGPGIVLKDHSFTGLDCRFLGCGHNIESPLVPYIASGLDRGGLIVIGVNCWLTTGVTVKQGVTIGHGSVVGAQSVVLADIPPFSIAVGNPCRVVKRFDFRASAWVNIADWADDLETFVPDEMKYRELLKQSGASMPSSLLSGSRRFGWI
jgi:acetyltransferase-like isoleucine patch superfamily enzyme